MSRIILVNFYPHLFVKLCPQTGLLNQFVNFGFKFLMWLNLSLFSDSLHSADLTVAQLKQSLFLQASITQPYCIKP